MLNVNVRFTFLIKPSYVYLNNPSKVISANEMYQNTSCIDLK